MKVAVMGAGSIGGYFGGMLARDGHDVTLIARGEHLEAIRRDGLRMQTEAGDFVVSCSATDNPADVRPVELALLTTKTYHNGDAVPAMAPMVGPETAILCRYLLPAAIFDCLERTPPGARNEIQLTDGLSLLMENTPLYACEFEGIRYDGGNPMGLLRASLEHALQREDTREAATELIRALAAQL